MATQSKRTFQRQKTSFRYSIITNPDMCLTLFGKSNHLTQDNKNNVFLKETKKV